MTSHDKLAIALLAILLTIATTVILFAANDPLAYQGADVHPRYSQAMQVGGVAGERDEQYWWVGWIVGSLLLAFLAGLMCFGLPRSTAAEGFRLNRGLGLLVAGITLLLLVVFAIGCFAYRDFGQTGQPLVKWIAPTATKILILGVWLVPLLFTTIYVVGFEKWFLPSDSDSGRTLAEGSYNDLERRG